MGKIKKNRLRKARNNPVGIEIERNGEEELQTNGGGAGGCRNGSGYLHTLIDQVKSHLAEERDSGLNSLSGAVQEPRFLKEALDEDIVRTVGPLLLDPSPMVRHSAAGALRNISASGYEICDLMVSQDIMTPLSMLFKQKYSEDWKPKLGDNDGLRIDTTSEIFIESIHLLLNLCESSELAVKLFNREKLAEILSPCLNYELYGFKIAITVAQCLNAVSEDNPIPELKPYIDKILSTNFPEDNPSWNYLSILSIGILFNLYKDQISQLSPDEINYAFKKLTREMERNINVKISAFSSDVPLGPIDGHCEIEVKKMTELQLAHENISNSLSAQQLAFEILANVMFTSGNDKDIDDNDSFDGDEEIIQDNCTEIDEEMEVEDSEKEIVPEIYDAIVKHQIFEKILIQLEMKLPFNVFQILKDNKEFGQNILKKSNQLKVTALYSFQNLLPAINMIDINGGIDKTVIFWDFFLARLKEELLLSKGNLKEDQFIGPRIEGYSSAQRSLMQKWIDEKTDLDRYTTDIIKSDYFELYSDIYKEMEIDKIRINIIKIIGGMGIIAAKKLSSPSSILLETGNFLLNCVISNPLDNLWIISEALDTIFDVFSEDDFNFVLNKLDLIKKLSNYQPQFKKRIQQKRRELGDNKAVIQSAKTNLSRFIDYKRKNGCKS